MHSITNHQSSSVEVAKSHGRGRVARWARRASVLGASLLGVAALAGPAAAATHYQFSTLDNQADRRSTSCSASISTA